MNRDGPTADELPRFICGAALVALLAALPVVMSLATPRGFVLMKFATGLPLAYLAAFAAAWGWWVRRRAAPSLPGSGMVVWAIAGLAAVVVVSSAQAAAWQQAMLGGYFRLEGALAWLGYLAAFLATRAWIRSGGTPRTLLDALVVASIAPACYALEQRFGIDFVTYSYGDAARSSGTLGNPMFLGAFLAMCIPLTLVRIADSGMSPPARLMLGAVGLLQLGGVLASGSRGPLVGLLAALMLLVSVRAHVRAAWGHVAGFAALLVVAAAVLVAINVMDGGRDFAKGAPGLARLVYDPQGADPASKSIRARLAMWTAAEAALREAPAWRLLTGYGPDVAHERFYAFMPVEKVRAEDFRREQVFDRVHSDLLDTWAALGLAGLAAIGALFSAALHSVAQRAFGCSARAAWRALAGAAGGAMALWFAATSCGAEAARWPLAGAGWVGGWLAAAMMAAWRRGGQQAHSGAGDRWLAAGAGASLVAFWMDAQAGLPVFATRMCFFVLLAVAITAPNAKAAERFSPADRVLSPAAWAVACAAALLSFQPAFGAQWNDGGLAPHLARWLPCLALLILGRWWCVPAGQSRAAGANARVAALVLALAALALLRYRVALPTNPADWLHARSAAEAALPVLIWLCPFALAWQVGRGTGVWQGRQTAGFVLAATLVVLAAAWPAWRLMVGSVAQAGSRALDRQATEQRVDLQAAAMAAAPWEWQHRYGLVDEALPGALGEVLAGLPTRASEERFLRHIALAESAARGGLIGGSVDPWRPFLVGLVLQVRGLSILLPLDAEGVARASDEADRWLGESLRLFPHHPRILEQVITLKLDRGEVAATLRLIDLFETAFPAEPEPYLLRIGAGRRFGLASEVERAVEAARSRLSAGALERVLSVAK